MNLAFHNQPEDLTSGDTWPPVAQSVPILRGSYEENWGVHTALLHRSTKEANDAFAYYVQYNEKKLSSGGKQHLWREDLTLVKDSTTCYREHSRIVSQKSRRRQRRTVDRRRSLQ